MFLAKLLAGYPQANSMPANGRPILAARRRLRRVRGSSVRCGGVLMSNGLSILRSRLLVK